MTDRIDQRIAIATALNEFNDRSLSDASHYLLFSLGYKSDRRIPITNVEQFIRTLDPSNRLTKREIESLQELSELRLLFQLTAQEFTPQRSLLDDGTTVDKTQIHSYLFFAAQLPDEQYTRSALSAIVRSINKPLPMPALVLLRHGDTISLGMIHRRLNKRDQSRDVLEKVTLIKDINLADPIRAHLEILNDFVLKNLDADFGVSNFVRLHEAWQKRLGSYALSSDFFREIADWYFWAHHQVENATIRLPLDCDTKQERSLFLIRLLTRIIFCWFLVEKRLIPAELFREQRVKNLIKDFNPTKDFKRSDKSPTWYRAVLQNLFFGVLNMPVEQRAFREKKKSGERYDKNRGSTNLWRYVDDFIDYDREKNTSAEWLRVAKLVPFLNGGLFDCLDQKYTRKEMKENIILDGFSDNSLESCHLPNDLFFGPERIVDLSHDYGEETKKTARSKKAKVRGLIEILSRYKFTVEENTPLEEEIALDPELLGKVFENLLASFDESTGKVARKAIGAFYTPREIVSYMVDEALKSYLSTQVPRCKGALEDLFSNKATLKEINPDTRDALVAAIGRVKILDPACGSGAFPMGALHRLVDLLQKLDPDNEKWRALQRRRALAETEAAFDSGDHKSREILLKEINDTFEFNASDYGRKLYLIENSIYGVDIQPIATQIAKLRFFISLVVEQSVDPSQPNLGILPLPNLETRIVAADTLTPIEKAESDLFSSDVDRMRGELADIRHHHFNARSPTSKRKWREADEAKRNEIAAWLKANHMVPEKSANDLASWNPYDQNGFAPFFDSEWMFGLPIGKICINNRTPATLRGNFSFVNEMAGQLELMEDSPQIVDSGFDIVIGNPPYVRIQNVEKSIASILKSEYSSAVGKFDLYVLFIENAFRLIRESGVICFIHPHRFLTADYGRGIKAFLDEVRGLHSAILFGVDQIFNAATTYTGVFSYSRRNESFKFKHANTLDFVKIPFIERAYTQSGSHWTLSTENNSSADLVEKLRNQKFPLIQICKGIYQGVITVGDDIFVLQGNISGKNFTGWSEAAQQEVTIESDIVKPLLKGENIKRYEQVSSSLYIIYPHFKDQKGKTRPYEEKELEARFPKALGYLRQFKSHLLAKKIQYKTNPIYWFALHRSRDMSIFEQLKILTPQLQNRPSFTIDRDGWFPDAGGYSLILNDATEVEYEFLLGVMNSSVLWYFIQSTSNPYNNSYYYFKTKYLEPFSVPTSSQQQKNEIANIVRYVCLLSTIDRKEGNTGSESVSEVSARDALMFSFWERTLNGMVYELYFPDEVHGAGLHLCSLVEQAKIPHINKIVKSKRLETMRDKFEDLYDPNHSLRIALDKLQTLDTVRIIEGNA